MLIKLLNFKTTQQEQRRMVMNIKFKSTTKTQLGDNGENYMSV